MNVVGVHRMGGLGNQLFQYCAARAVAQANMGCRIWIGPETLNTHNHNGHDYAKIFMRDAEQVSGERLDRLAMFDQGHFCAPWDPTNLMLPCTLRGYFQYLPAIERVLPIVRNEWLGSLQTLRNQIKNDLKMPEEDACIGMHVRRGDYLKLPDFHFIQSLSYYEKAFHHISQQNNKTSPKVFIVSDDPEWCMQQPWSFPHYVSQSTDELHDLSLLSLCRGGVIMGNSTFSWWGAVLARAKTTIYPSRWINLKTDNLFPNHWIQM